MAPDMYICISAGMCSIYLLYIYSLSLVDMYLLYQHVAMILIRYAFVGILFWGLPRFFHGRPWLLQ